MSHEQLIHLCYLKWEKIVVATCVLFQHANAVKAQAQEYVEKKQAKKVMARSITGSLATAQALVRIADVKYFNTAKPGTFFARWAPSPLLDIAFFTKFDQT